MNQWAFELKERVKKLSGIVTRAPECGQIRKMLEWKLACAVNTVKTWLHTAQNRHAAKHAAAMYVHRDIFDSLDIYTQALHQH